MTVSQRARALTAASSATVLLGVLVPGGATAAAGDTEPPVGSFVVLSASSSDDPGPLTVEVVQNSLKDDRTPTADIVREVSWGTGVGYEPWRKGTSISFAYTSVGRYDLRVRVTDRAGNSSVEDLGTVVVSDSFAPKLTVNRPASDRRTAWRAVRGYARDVGLAGMDFVRVKSWQQRTRGWYAYQGEERGWVRTDSEARAKAAAVAVRVPTTTNGAWKVALEGVRAGGLVVRTFARDAAGNRSKAVAVRRTLVD
ncbi:PKD domain-containing protein [Nocardioides iriomotensis]|uniref:PKD domain-containing protein n=1 Tax=Nocardioides iriomotensis TaxID=715784 RepID=A0A4Q5J4Y6_9ACTN|nr:PKD domain-containing protein [Nocardioides iriomotensis]RYU12818.1 hypothetical protein ETU37_07570 [Nocardioides iriomotensis]